uniref:Uncharacterized protein n=1 Tax=Romanomermis culicivorax TaxID=13658 RepID=A0A915HV13_ROMCU
MSKKIVASVYISDNKPSGSQAAPAASPPPSKIAKKMAVGDASVFIGPSGSPPPATGSQPRVTCKFLSWAVQPSKAGETQPSASGTQPSVCKTQSSASRTQQSSNKTQPSAGETQQSSNKTQPSVGETQLAANETQLPASKTPYLQVRRSCPRRDAALCRCNAGVSKWGAASC